MVELKADGKHAQISANEFQPKHDSQETIPKMLFWLNTYAALYDMLIMIRLSSHCFCVFVCKSLQFEFPKRSDRLVLRSNRRLS